MHSALARGDNVIATGRDAATKLKHLEGTGPAICDLDVSLPEAEIKEKVDKAAETYGQIDVLINNAGYAAFGTFEEFRQELHGQRPRLPANQTRRAPATRDR